ncbi:hypothetical protein RR46_11660 [Papilio xuthus]|uniref:Uncharacterized protein n=1 Tax=Papilio xuthus TaxID=66420 RepID=A0A194PRK9_PAPXU|nr:hypothetical protein RR46_11660 [Papilio xuthus]
MFRLLFVLIVLIASWCSVESAVYGQINFFGMPERESPVFEPYYFDRVDTRSNDAPEVKETKESQSQS